MPAAYTWAAKGETLKIRTRWASAGRINVISTLGSKDDEQHLEYRLLEGKCCKKAVIAYLDSLAAQAEKQGMFTVVVLDNAPFHRAKEVQAQQEKWQDKGLFLRYLPSYCPHLNLIENVWRRVKSFLMPRRYYNSLAELKQALLSALALLGAVELQC